MGKRRSFVGRLWGRKTKRRQEAARPLRVELLESRQLLTTVTWIGGWGNFNDPAQWDIGVPGPGDTAVISSSAAGATITQDAESGASIDSLDIQAPDATIGGSYPLAVASTINVNSANVGPYQSDTIATNLTGGQLKLTGGGELHLTAANAYPGATTVQNGTLVAETVYSLPDGTDLNIGPDTSMFGTPPNTNFTRAVPWWTRTTDEAIDVSPAGVVYSSGSATISGDDFNLGTANRLYGSQLGTSSGGLGTGWMLADQPYVVSGGGQ